MFLNAKANPGGQTNVKAVGGLFKLPEKAGAHWKDLLTQTVVSHERRVARIATLPQSNFIVTQLSSHINGSHS